MVTLPLIRTINKTHQERWRDRPADTSATAEPAGAKSGRTDRWFWKMRVPRVNLSSSGEVFFISIVRT